MTQPALKTIIANEENLVRILDALKEGVIAHDLDRRIFFFNREAERLTGRRREEVVGKDCHEAFGAPFCGEHCLFKDACRHVPEFAEYPLSILTRDGEHRNVEMSVTRLSDETGRILGVIAIIKDITDRIRFHLRTGELSGYANIIGRDRKMLQVFQQIQDLSGYDYPVHIFGETGTGKELVAEAIHENSRRNGAPFAPINCGALPEGLIESELFGHMRGAFTGAIRDKKGRFELANGGTVFLDEVAELPRDMQVKLLRFLQTGRFEKVGGEKTVSVDVRIISATNVDLKEAVRNKLFREDLYYRLNVIPIHLPPLRDRVNDIPLLTAHFLKDMEASDASGSIGLSREALSMLMSYAWPGNVRELRNALQFAMVKCKNRLIQAEDLPLEIKEFHLERLAKTSAGADREGIRRGPPRKLDVDAVLFAMQKTGQNKAKTARYLGVGRATLYRFLNEHALVLGEHGSQAPGGQA